MSCTIINKEREEQEDKNTENKTVNLPDLKKLKNLN